jgi:3-oxoacyl-[acyl-carrier-protein] synthase-1
MTAPKADGEGATNAARAALHNAHITPEQIGYVNLHGTGTRLNDAMESKAMAQLFPATTPMSSTKGLTGHTLGAASALELAFCCMALETGCLPPHQWDGERDPELPPLHLVRQGETAQNLRFALSNSFAFGGCNVSLVVEKLW